MQSSTHRWFELPNNMSRCSSISMRTWSPSQHILNQSPKSPVDCEPPLSFPSFFVFSFPSFFVFFFVFFFVTIENYSTASRAGIAETPLLLAAAIACRWDSSLTFDFWEGLEPSVKDKGCVQGDGVSGTGKRLARHAWLVGSRTARWL